MTLTAAQWQEAIVQFANAGPGGTALAAANAAVPADAIWVGGSDGTNLQGGLVESASHPNIRFAIYNGANELAVDSAGRLIFVRSTVALFTTTQTAQPTGNSGDLTVSPFTEIFIDINITANPAGSNPTIQFEWDRKGADGIYYPIWYSDLINGLPANPTKISVSIGAGLTWNESVGTVGRLLWTVGGTSVPTYTFTPNVYGK